MSPPTNQQTLNCQKIPDSGTTCDKNQNDAQLSYTVSAFTNHSFDITDEYEVQNEYEVQSFLHKELMPVNLSKFASFNRFSKLKLQYIN